MNYRMNICYDGSNYNGWQIQKNTDKTIQKAIMESIKKATGEDVDLIASGRTDKGVHAYNQIANFKLKQDFNAKDLEKKINDNVFNDIVITGMKKVDERFHSRYNAVNKTYVYKILNQKVTDPFKRKHYYQYREPIDVELMEQAIKYLIGKKDFQCFSSVKNNKKSTIKIVEDINIEKMGNEIIIEIRGTSFLYNQVRIMIGTLLEVGIGQMKPEAIEDIFKNKTRSHAGRTIPPHGLYLKNVTY